MSPSTHGLVTLKKDFVGVEPSELSAREGVPLVMLNPRHGEGWSLVRDPDGREGEVPSAWLAKAVQEVSGFVTLEQFRKIIDRAGGGTS